VKTLVTGGAGFIGSNIVAAIRRRSGDTVVVLDNLSSGHRSNVPADPGVQFIEADVCDRSAVDRSMKDCQVVFHLAASVGNQRSIQDPIRDAQTNVLGTLNVLEAARRQGVRKVVISSSAGIFGELRGLPISEDHPVEPDTPYGATKLCAEKQGLAYAKLYGLEVVCLRYFNVYGPHQRYDAYGNVIPIFVSHILAGRPITIFGDGEQTRDFVNVRDVVQANLKAAGASGVWGAFNIGSGSALSINQLVAQLADAVETSPIVHYGPERKGDVRHSLADITAASRAFAYAPSVDIITGLKEYVEWCRAEVVEPV